MYFEDIFALKATEDEFGLASACKEDINNTEHDSIQTIETGEEIEDEPEMSRVSRSPINISEELEDSL